MCTFCDNTALSKVAAAPHWFAKFEALPSPRRLDYGAGLVNIELAGMQWNFIVK
jgi:hypothetical protein